VNKPLDHTPADGSTSAARDDTVTMVLRDGEARRVRRGHPWVFSNEVDTARSPFARFTAGATVALRDHDGGFIGWADVQPQALLCARVLSRVEAQFPDADWLRMRLRAALARRERLYAEPFYRLVYADADGLSGLIIDRYDDVLVVQTGSAGMERRLPLIVEALVDLFSPRAVVLKNDAAARSQENLPEVVEVAYGSFADPLHVRALGLGYETPLLAGQKTGWYYDHADNRRWLAERWFARTAGARVLDLYAYAGAWSVAAAAAGAASVLAVDSSVPALDVLAANAARNGLADRIECLQSDVPKALGRLAAEGRQFDVVVLDPPAFIRRRADEKAGKDMYRKVNLDALRVLAPGGLLVSASCSALLTADDHMAAVRTAARQGRRDLSLVHRGGPGPDHPVHPALPMSEYLKCLFMVDVGS
jgi:23S rRNA (cytosine1962-C5)-methyltransferase